MRGSYDRTAVLHLHAAPWLEANDWQDPDNPEDLRYQESRIGIATAPERSTPLETSDDRYSDSMTVRLHTEGTAGPEAPEAVGEPFGSWRVITEPGRGGKRLGADPVVATDTAGRRILVNRDGIVARLE